MILIGASEGIKLVLMSLYSCRLSQIHGSPNVHVGVSFSPLMRRQNDPVSAHVLRRALILRPSVKTFTLKDFELAVGSVSKATACATL